MDTRVKSAKLDPVTLEVIRNALLAISTEMAADLQRTSYNMMIYEVRVFCTAVLTHCAECRGGDAGEQAFFYGSHMVGGIDEYAIASRHAAA